MKRKRFGNSLFVRLEKGEDVVEGIIAACREENVTVAQVSAIGALLDAELGAYDLATRSYTKRKFDEPLELAFAGGTVGILDGEPFPHMHVILSGHHMETYGGHLYSATVGPTVEVVLNTFGGDLPRRMDDEIGLKLWDL